MCEKKTSPSATGLRCKLILGQTVRVITTNQKALLSGEDELSFRNHFGRIGEVNSITGFGKPTTHHEIGVVFKGDREDVRPTIFDPDELETLGPKLS